VRFHDPLLLLLLLPLLAAVAWRARRRRSVLYSSVAEVRRLPRTLSQRVHRVLGALLPLSLALLVVSLARPQEGREEFRVRTEGIAIELCLDRSGSMQAEDFVDEGARSSRLAVVKRVAGDFIKGRRDDLVGLVSFGGYAESVCPLTLDHDAAREVLGEVRIPEPLLDAQGNVVDEEGYREEMSTAIGDAIAVGTARLKDAKAKSRVLILVSDGESNAGIIEPADAAEAAKKLGIRIYTIGVGSTGIAPIPVMDAFGRKVYRREMVRLDEATLKRIATLTGGEYFNARDTETLEKVYGKIDRLEKTETEGVLYTQYRELYLLGLWPALGMLVILVSLRATLFPSLP